MLRMKDDPEELLKTKMEYNYSAERDARPAWYGRRAGSMRRANQWVELARETHKANWLNRGGVARTFVWGRLRCGARPHSEGARCLQYCHRATLLRCWTEERQIGFLLPGAPKTDLRQFAVSAPGLPTLLVPPKAYTAPHRNVSSRLAA